MEYETSDPKRWQGKKKGHPHDVLMVVIEHSYLDDILFDSAWVMHDDERVDLG